MRKWIERVKKKKILKQGKRGSNKRKCMKEKKNEGRKEKGKMKQ